MTTMDRRSFLRTAGAAAGAAALIDAPIMPLQAKPSAHEAMSAIANMTRRNRDSVQSTVAPWAGSFDVHTAGHLYRRAGFGATMTEINAAIAMKPSDLVDALLDDKWTLDANMPSPPTHSEQWMLVPPYQGPDLQLQIKQNNDDSYANSSIRRTWAAQMAKPQTMLREKMVYFWANHFVIEAQKVQYPQIIYHYLDYFRHHPWGNFKQMVKDVSVSPGMLYYLDGWYSRGTNPNENYARELMELFTLGVTDKDGNANYSEDDIKALALALTGYSIDFTTANSQGLPATFDVNGHDGELKKPFHSLGAPIRAYGLSSSLHTFTDDIIDCLFQYRGDKLAYYICGKLYQYFVYHDISGATEQDIITQLAATFQNGNWELKPVLQQLLKSEHFFDEANIGAAIKSPFEHMIGLTRQFDIAVDDLMTGTMETFSQALLNQSLLDPPNVKGWPGYRTWISTTTLPMRNQGFAVRLTQSGATTGIAAIGSTGYGENHTAILWSDADLRKWAAQFADYKGDVHNFIGQLATFLCAQAPPTDLQTSFIFGALGFPDYDWPGMSDVDRTAKIRLILSAIVSLPEYQLM